MGARWVALALVAAVAASAQASHMGQYTDNPVEHDAQGAVPEPDDLVTSVLGPTVANCVLDLPPFDGRCAPDPVARPSGALGSVMAPGCTGGANERRLDGQCGLWTVGLGKIAPATIPPPLSETGMPGDAAPGAYTPTKSDAVRFLDGRHTTVAQPPAGGTVVLDANRKLQELERLTGLDLVVSRSVLPGQQMVWMWYGEWTDRNGNGVVDHLTPAAGNPTQNEFAWLGSCVKFGNPVGPRNPDAIAKGLCKEDGNPNIEPPGAPCADPASITPCTGSTLHAWLFPGNHHASGAGDDLPGNQVANVLFCDLDPACADEMDQELYGDPLLGPQGAINPDVTGHERTGDDSDDTRQWTGGEGWAAYFYGDDGLLVTLVEVYGVNCGFGSANRFVLVGERGCTFTDVDRQTTIHPDVEALLVGGPGSYPNGGLKGTARGAWRGIFDGTFPNLPDFGTLSRKLDSILGGEPVYQATLGPERGMLNDALLDPGRSREPNAPEDRYPGAAHKPCGDFPVGDARNPTAALDPEELESQHRGFCNVGPDGAYAQAYQAHRHGPRGWADASGHRHLVYSTPVALVPGQPCQWCLSGSLVSYPGPMEPAQLPPDPNRHARTLGPGIYTFGALAGTWRDLPHTFDESLWPDPPGTTLVTYPADGWVGAVVAASGQWRYRSFFPQACTTEKDGPFEASIHEAAECNPYLDGNLQNPHNGPAGLEGERELTAACRDAAFTLEPVDGSLDTQILVWRAYQSGFRPDPLDLNNDGDTGQVDLEAYGPGPVAPLRFAGQCGGGSIDLLHWPEGNRGDDIITRLTAAVPLGRDVDGDGLQDTDFITDVDYYVDWEPL